mmetsp:Transcript_73698/g.221565  ORF Transcript_73698/g.221565 Transcript_73698/m.221565 type:complete len:201 (-) Transcript_73698:301-903(-)
MPPHARCRRQPSSPPSSEPTPPWAHTVTPSQRLVARTHHPALPAAANAAVGRRGAASSFRSQVCGACIDRASAAHRMCVAPTAESVTARASHREAASGSPSYDSHPSRAIPPHACHRRAIPPFARRRCARARCVVGARPTHLRLCAVAPHGAADARNFWSWRCSAPRAACRSASSASRPTTYSCSPPSGCSSLPSACESM